MKTDLTNYGILVDAEQWYPVTYTIDQSGKKHVGNLVMWDPIEDGAEVGNRQWWFMRQQGRFYDYYLCAN